MDDRQLYQGIDPCELASLFLHNLTKRSFVLAKFNISIIQELRCIECPQGAECDYPGVTWSTLTTIPGWWRSGNNSLTVRSRSRLRGRFRGLTRFVLSKTQFFRCILDTNCLGGRDSECAQNRDGPLCALCMPGYQAATSNSQCVIRLPSRLLPRF